MKSNIIVIVLLSLLSCNSSFAQREISELRNRLLSTIKPYKAKIGIAVKALEDGDTVTINNMHHFPMQSVYKFPLALMVLRLSDDGKLSLLQKVHINKSDLHKTWSPMKDQFPKGNIDLSIAELLQYSVSQSDNNACDILFRLAGGPAAVNEYIHGLGIQNIEIVATEHQMHQSWNIQYTNWCFPWTMVELLDNFYQGKYLSESSNSFLMKLMTESGNSPKRLKGLLPAATVVAHKTGSSGANNKGLIAASNDVGIITLPDNRHIAVSVFVSDATEPYETTEKIIAVIAKETYDYFNLKTNDRNGNY